MTRVELEVRSNMKDFMMHVVGVTGSLELPWSWVAGPSESSAAAPMINTKGWHNVHEKQGVCDVRH